MVHGGEATALQTYACVYTRETSRRPVYTIGIIWVYRWHIHVTCQARPSHGDSASHRHTAELRPRNSQLCLSTLAAESC